MSIFTKKLKFFDKDFIYFQNQTLSTGFVKEPKNLILW